MFVMFVMFVNSGVKGEEGPCKFHLGRVFKGYI